MVSTTTVCTLSPGGDSADLLRCAPRGAYLTEYVHQHLNGDVPSRTAAACIPIADHVESHRAR
eukprot:CAMPEP_0170400510 /NCGR_PEP_ID=MMETSP0117_2-20130122/24539_1 /TAXON_ID=400756 /ORGANISM="Durinskia baltica, Strain CSIRO CS-38" /LENGTH=62 /DNA_ID=CAMNT_0010657269 /DNA_START=376 /DNA_END=559 /DNA_ORIENTATION=-